MPRDQETSFGHNPATSDDPLFRSPDDERDDQALAGQGDPLRDPLDSDDDPESSDTPIGDGIPTGRHADDTDTRPSDTPGEWVAGNRGPGYVSGRDGSVVPSQPGQPAAESTDPLASDPDRAASATDPVTGDPVTGDSVTGDSVTGDAAANGTRATTDLDDPTDPDAPVVSDTTTTSDELGAPVTRDTTDTTAGTGATSDLRTTRDPEVAPDAVFTRDSGAPADPNTTSTPATAAPADADTPADAATPAATATPAETSNAATTPAAAASAGTSASGASAAPVPGAPGTGSTTGVQAASAALVTHSTELHDDWARIQSSFVDDPRGSVSQAADLVSQVTSSLVNALQEREQTLRGSWDSHGDQSADTENLRNALRDYRAFFEMLTKV